jgi:hypothetical protein
MIPRWIIWLVLLIEVPVRYPLNAAFDNVIWYRLRFSLGAVQFLLIAQMIMIVYVVLMSRYIDAIYWRDILTRCWQYMHLLARCAYIINISSIYIFKKYIYIYLQNTCLIWIIEIESFDPTVTSPAPRPYTLEENRLIPGVTSLNTPFKFKLTQVNTKQILSIY